MAFSEYGDCDAVGLAALVRAGEVSPAEVLEEAIVRAERIDAELNFLAHRAYDAGRQRAADADLPRGALAGVPWLVKELATAWAGQAYTNSLPYLKDQLAPIDAAIVTRLKAAGAVPFGKSTSPEQGWSLATESGLHGVTRSPWDPARTPGGSSGGSAVAVATRVTPLADASDGGGSIRVPAANCGLVGLKPARGRITLAPIAVDYWYGGAVIFGLSRSVRDTAVLLDVLAGSLPGEPYRLPPPPRAFAAEVGAPCGRLRIALVTDTPDHGTPLDAEVRAAVEDAARLLESLGHHLEPRPVPYDYWPLYKTYTALIAAQTAAFLEAMADVVGRPATPADMAPLYWSMNEKGRRLSAIDHSNQLEQMRTACVAMAQTMSPYDAWLMPTVPMLPRTHGHYDMSLDVETYDDTRMGPDCCYTAPFNASGAPAISLPLGMSRAGLPIGVQLVGREADEATLIRLAAQLEQARPWAARRPPITT